MTKPRKFAFETPFASEYVRPWLFNAYRLVRVLFPFKAQNCIRMRLLQYPLLERVRNFIENVLGLVKILLVFFLRLGA